jgi:hypothetical protein
MRSCMSIVDRPLSTQLGDRIDDGRTSWAGRVRGGEGEGSVGGGAPAGTGVSPRTDDEHGVRVVVRSQLFRVSGGGVGPAHDGRARGPQRPESGRVGAGLGGKVTAEAEHVRPRPEPGPGGAGVAPAQFPSSRNEPAGVRRRLGVEPDGGLREPGRQVAGGFGCFGGVLSQVAGDVLFGDLRTLQAADDGEWSDLADPLDHPAADDQQDVGAVLDGEGVVVDLDGDGLAGVLDADVDALLGDCWPQGRPSDWSAGRLARRHESPKVVMTQRAAGITDPTARSPTSRFSPDAPIGFDGALLIVCSG